MTERKRWGKWLKKIDKAQTQTGKVKFEICNSAYFHPVEDALFKAFENIEKAKNEIYDNFLKIEKNLK